MKTLETSRPTARGQSPRRAGKLDRMIGERLRELRLEERLSQRELGAAAGITGQQIHKIEAGIDRMTVTHAIRFCDALERPLIDLLGEFEGISS